MIISKLQKSLSILLILLIHLNDPSDFVNSSDNESIQNLILLIHQTVQFLKLEAISKIDVLIKPNSAEMSFKGDEHEPITKVIDFEASDAKESKTINLEIDKPKNSTLLFNLRMENLHSGK